MDFAGNDVTYIVQVSECIGEFILPTIKDVAKEAGVSTATVSRVINNSAQVPEKKAEMIRTIINKMGYDVSSNKRLAVNKNKETLGLLLNVVTSSYGGLLASGVEKVANKHGLKLIIMTSPNDPKTEEDNLQHLINIGCKKIILHYQSLSDSSIRKYLKREPNIVVLNRKIEGAENRCVWIDHAKGGYLATKALLEKGHRNIAFLTSNIDVPDKVERYKGYLRALNEYNIDANLDWLEEVLDNEQSIVSGVSNLIDRVSTITAIVTFNDYYAAITMQTLNSRGVHVPNDVSVVGYDNALPQCFFNPKLSTINYPIERMAMNAAILAIHGEESSVDRSFNPTFIKRDSTKNLNA